MDQLLIGGVGHMLHNHIQPSPTFNNPVCTAPRPCQLATAVLVGLGHQQPCVVAELVVCISLPVVIVVAIAILCFSLSEVRCPLRLHKTPHQLTMVLPHTHGFCGAFMTKCDINREIGLPPIGQKEWGVVGALM